jgi:hypothetical protein
MVPLWAIFFSSGRKKGEATSHGGFSSNIAEIVVFLGFDYWSRYGV